jgi:hypothetical protein
MALNQQTFLELITRLAHEMNDCVTLTATANGTTTTFVDNVNINSSRESYDGWEWFGTSSPNLGVVATVTATATNTITLTPAVTSTVASNTAMLVNKRGRGFRIQDYKRAINGAIRDFNGTALLPVIDMVTLDFDADLGTIVPDEDTKEVYRVEFQNSEGRWREIKRAMSPGADGWSAEAPDGVIRVEGQPALEADTRPIRLHGYKRQAELSALADLCYFDSGGIVARAAYLLTRSSLDRDPKYAQQILLYRQESEDAMSRLRILRQPGTVTVRL